MGVWKLSIFKNIQYNYIISHIIITFTIYLFLYTKNLKKSMPALRIYAEYNLGIKQLLNLVLAKV